MCDMARLLEADCLADILKKNLSAPVSSLSYWLYKKDPHALSIYDVLELSKEIGCPGKDIHAILSKRQLVGAITGIGKSLQDLLSVLRDVTKAGRVLLDLLDESSSPCCPKVTGLPRFFTPIPLEEMTLQREERRAAGMSADSATWRPTSSLQLEDTDKTLIKVDDNFLHFLSEVVHQTQTRKRPEDVINNSPKTPCCAISCVYDRKEFTQVISSVYTIYLS
ncbi:uncharacterized protein [Dendropsophus ebraccatus]|uniref:uncharacterized protein isoform X2 n=1 Tax=Dendropsophus ebraccatus TaxID=150705 RepID=UPI003831648B